jgi:Tfp pilus assembly pilus retraction ATPase PilT
MKTDEILTLKALQLKSTLHNQNGSDLVDRLIEGAPEEVKKSLRNICAFISPELFEKVEIVCNNLEMSKRQVVEMALLDFMQKVDSIMDKVGPFDDLITDDKGQPVSSTREISEG